MLPLVVCVLLGIVYWCIEEKVTDYSVSSTITATIKWSAVIGLIAEMLRIHYHELYEQFTYIVQNSIIFLLYSIGDIVIQFNEQYSIGFFIGGHIVLLSKFVLQLTMLSVGYIAIVLVSVISVTLISSYAFKKNSEHIEGLEFAVYVIYIFVLANILITPVFVSGYIGHMFFVVSDVLIGFKIKQLSKLTFPLYYTSLLFLIYVKHI